MTNWKKNKPAHIQTPDPLDTLDAPEQPIAPPDYAPTVDEPPGKDGYQAQHPDWEEVPVPEWPPGQNPPGTNPPVPPKNDPATTLQPGTHPVFDTPSAAPPETPPPPPDPAMG